MVRLQAAVTNAGADAVVTPWDDQAIDWSSFDLAVIRSPWDYSWRSAEFLKWVDRVAALTRLANPPAIVHWNAHKEYLKELAAHRVPVVGTTYLQPTDAIELPDDREFVVKPAVGAGARFAARYQPAEHAQAVLHARRIQADGVPVMVQPYLERIDVTGERALVFIHGKFLHAIRKSAVLAPGLRFDEPRDAHPNTAPWIPTAAEISVAEQALAVVPNSADLLYARVDMADGLDGDPVITELELVEPGLYLRFHEGSENTFASAIVHHARALMAGKDALH